MRTTQKASRMVKDLHCSEEPPVAAGAGAERDDSGNTFFRLCYYSAFGRAVLLIGCQHTSKV